MPTSRLPRRTFLRASGVAIGLPLLDAMLPMRARAGQAAADAAPRRMVLIARALGLHAPFFFPETTGRGYQPSRYLKHLEPHRGDFTVFSGTSHHYGGGHGTMAGLFTGVSPDRMRQGDIRNTISLDQEVAARLASPTRYASLVLGTTGVSWNRKGVVIPAESRATEMFKQLFVAGTPEEIARQMQRLANGRSILDGVREQAKGLVHQLGSTDRDRIDLLLTSIREAEERLQQDQEWVQKPKPVVDVKPFTNDYSGVQLIERESQWYELVRLALSTDSTRVVSLMLHSHATVSIQGQQFGHHEASHHGQNESTIEKLATIEEAQLKALGEFFGKMKQTEEAGTSLLSRTQILYAGDLGNASAHTTSNLPVLLAGGGFQHAGHVAFDRKNNLPLSNLYVRMLQQLGIETDRFGSSTGQLTEV